MEVVPVAEAGEPLSIPTGTDIEINTLKTEVQTSRETMELVTEWEVREAHKAGKKAIQLSQKGIVTPLARDTASELGITIEKQRG